MAKVVVTGGSGFIGTNLIEHLLNNGYEVVNYDIQEPQIAERNVLWKKIDISDKEEFHKELRIDTPDYLVNLAARTDLMGKSLDDYKINISAVQNIIEYAEKKTTLKKIVFASSMLVCKVGYMPRDDMDFCPSTVYGESKAVAEKKLREAKLTCDWVIIRPTSIWGPWFGTPYRDFFEMVIRHRYVHIGHKSCTKTYGYVGNAVKQIESIMLSDEKINKSRVFYIGDYSPYAIEKWADEISAQLGFKNKTVPYWMIRCAACLGDVLKAFGHHFPMTSFRLKNMTTDNIVDLSNTYRIVGELPYTRLEGITETLRWMECVCK